MCSTVNYYSVVMIKSLSAIKGLSREDLLREVSFYFSITELVCPHVYARWGASSWVFIDTSLLRVLLWLRILCGNSIYINSYGIGGSKSERGLRCNMCSLVRGKSSVYLSAHILGKAVDFNVARMSIKAVHTLIKENMSTLPCVIRLERITSAPTWVHIDVRSVVGHNDTEAYIDEFDG